LTFIFNPWQVQDTSPMHKQKIKVKGQAVEKLDWKQTGMTKFMTIPPKQSVTSAVNWISNDFCAE